LINGAPDDWQWFRALFVNLPTGFCGRVGIGSGLEVHDDLAVHVPTVLNLDRGAVVNAVRGSHQFRSAF
jgi:hypothetical protein